MLASIPGSCKIWENIKISAKFAKYLCKIWEVFYSDKPCLTGRGRGVWSHNAVLLKDNPKRRLQHHKMSSTHLKAILMRTNARMEEALSSPELLSCQEKQQANFM